MRILTLCCAIIISTLAACRARTPLRDARPAWRIASLNDTTQAAVIGALKVVLAQYASSGPAFCLELRGAPPANENLDPSQALLDALADQRPMERGSACPPTYASMVTNLDAAGTPIDRRPRGSVDPFRVSVLWFDPDALARGILQIEVWQGTGGTRYRCVRSSDAHRSWQCTGDVRLLS